MSNDNLNLKSLAKLGQINYVNSLPLTLPIERGLVRVNAEIHNGTPQELNYRYSDGSLDLGAMSAFFYLNSTNLSLIPQLSIASKGPVGSVLFFCKRPLITRQHLSVTVSSASATSVNLLSLLLREELQIVPEFKLSSAPDLNRDDVEAVLVIGDQALHVDNDWGRISERIDLGEWWNALFRCPMVFAVWAARVSWQVVSADLCDEIAKTLRQSLELGLGEAFPQVLAVAKARTGLPEKRLERYFRQELDYSFTDSHVASLNRYKSLCEKYELLDGSMSLGQKSWLPVA